VAQGAVRPSGISGRAIDSPWDQGAWGSARRAPPATKNFIAKYKHLSVPPCSVNPRSLPRWPASYGTNGLKKFMAGNTWALCANTFRVAEGKLEPSYSRSKLRKMAEADPHGI